MVVAGIGAPRRPGPRAPQAVWAVAHAINDAYPTLYLPLLPILMTRWHFNIAQAGLLVGLLALSTQATQPLLGAWSDRRGGPWFIVGGLMAGSLGSAVGLAWAPSYGVFALALMMGGLGNAAFHPHMAALVASQGVDHRGQRMSAWMVSGLVGHALAPLAVVAAWEWGGRWGVSTLALPGLLAAVALYGSARPLTRRTAGRAPRATNWRDVWRHGRPLVAVIVLRNWAAMSLLTLLPLLWRQRGGSLADTGLLIMVVYGAGAVGNLLGGRLSDRWGARAVLVVSVVGAAGAALSWATNLGAGPWLFAEVALWGFAINGAGAVILVYGQQLFPGRAAMGAGLTMGLGNTVGALGGWIIGMVAEAAGLVPAVEWAAAVMGLALLPAMFLRPATSEGRTSSQPLARDV